MVERKSLVEKKKKKAEKTYCCKKSSATKNLETTSITIDNLSPNKKKIGYKLVCHQMSAETVAKQRKCSLHLYLMFCKSRFNPWITSYAALFHLSSTTCKTKIEYISCEKRYKPVVLQKAS